MESCFWGTCFALNPAAPKFFGFSEFLTGTALMILAWTTTDAKYRFRISVANLPIRKPTYVFIGVIGSLTLLTDLWRAQGWLVPYAPNYFPVVITPEIWQALMGFFFLATFMVWCLFAYVHPSIFGRRNARRFAESVQYFIINSPASDQAIIAQELGFSAHAIIKYATSKISEAEDVNSREISSAQRCANSLLLLVAHKTFCRTLVCNAPGTAYYFFQAIDELKKYDIYGVDAFARNFVNEALRNKDSFIYHEENGYQSGLVGYDRPFTTVMFENYNMVRGVDALLDPEDATEKGRFDSQQWKAYCRLVVTAIDGCMKAEECDNTPVLVRAIGNIRNAFYDLNTLGPDTPIISETRARLEVVTEFIRQVEGMIAGYEPASSPLRRKHEDPAISIHDAIAELIDALVRAAARIQRPLVFCRYVHEDLVWGEVLGGGGCKSSWLLSAKTCRLIFDRIRNIWTPASSDRYVLGFCLNVFSLEYCYSGSDYLKGQRLLHRAVLAWTRKNYLRLYHKNPSINDCLCEGISLDLERSRLVKVYPANTKLREPRYEYLDLIPYVSPGE